MKTSHKLYAVAAVIILIIITAVAVLLLIHNASRGKAKPIDTPTPAASQSFALPSPSPSPSSAPSEGKEITGETTGVVSSVASDGSSAAISFEWGKSKQKLTVSASLGIFQGVPKVGDKVSFAYVVSADSRLTITSVKVIPSEPSPTPTVIAPTIKLGSKTESIGVVDGKFLEMGDNTIRYQVGLLIPGQSKVKVDLPKDIWDDLSTGKTLKVTYQLDQDGRVVFNSLTPMG